MVIDGIVECMFKDIHDDHRARDNEELRFTDTKGLELGTGPEKGKDSSSEGYKDDSVDTKNELDSGRVKALLFRRHGEKRWRRGRKGEGERDKREWRVILKTEIIGVGRWGVRVQALPRTREEGERGGERRKRNGRKKRGSGAKGEREKKPPKCSKTVPTRDVEKLQKKKWKKV